MGWWILRDKDWKETDMTMGDSAWDIMGPAIDKVIAVYEDEVGRLPHFTELEAVFVFCAVPALEKAKEKTNE